MSEGHCPMVRIVLLDQHMPIETSHLRNGEHADTAEGSGGHRQHLSLCYVGAKPIVRRGLQAVECDVPGDDISLQGTLGHFLGKIPRHDHLIFHAAGRKLFRIGIPAVESHESVIVGVGIPALDGLPIHVFRHGIVDIQQCDNVLADTGADKLA